MTSASELTDLIFDAIQDKILDDSGLYNSYNLVEELIEKAFHARDAEKAKTDAEPNDA